MNHTEPIVEFEQGQDIAPYLSDQIDLSRRMSNPRKHLLEVLSSPEIKDAKFKVEFIEPFSSMAEFLVIGVPRRRAARSMLWLLGERKSEMAYRQPDHAIEFSTAQGRLVNVDDGVSDVMISTQEVVPGPTGGLNFFIVHSAFDIKTLEPRVRVEYRGRADYPAFDRYM